MKRVVIVAVVIALVMAALIAKKIQAQQAALEGPAWGSAVVESTGVDLSARLQARVTTTIEEGQRVAKGEVIVHLDCAEPAARRDAAAANLVAARAKVEGAAAATDAATHRIAAARAAIRAAHAQREALQAQTALAAREAARLSSMGEHATLSRRDQAQAKADSSSKEELAAAASEQAQRRTAVAAQAQAEGTASEAKVAEGAVAAAEATLRQAELTVAECEIVSPIEGVVERVYFDVGELVSPGMVVARIVDPDIVTATFYIPNADVEQAQVGAPAQVIADAYGDEHAFTGIVTRVGLEAAFTPRNVQTRSDRDRLVFPVEVRVTNEPPGLRAGMPVTVRLTESQP